MSNCLKITEEYLVFSELEVEQLLDSFKEQANEHNYEIIGYSSTKKNKKNLEYYIVKIVKEFVREKDLVSE
jgi:hypothetical protein